MGHYCIFDFFYLVGHTMVTLPHKLSDFKQIVVEYFPTLVDTKIMISRFKNLVSNNITTGLSTLVEFFQTRGPQALSDEKERLILQADEIFDSSMHHDAGFDAFLTAFTTEFRGLSIDC